MRTDIVRFLAVLFTLLWLSCSESQSASMPSDSDTASDLASNALEPVITYLRSMKPFQPAQGSWAGATIPAERRIGHRATWLAETRRFLITGGWDGESTFQSFVEWYDPITTSGWNSERPMAEPRAGHTATRLSDSRVLVAGGLRSLDIVLGTSEIYQPLHGGWFRVGPMTQDRAGHSATLLDNGKVLIVGGWDGLLQKIATAEVFDPDTETWSLTGNLSVPRGGHQATLLPDGNVIVMGGEDGEMGPSAEVYDVSSGLWFKFDRMPASK